MTLEPEQDPLVAQEDVGLDLDGDRMTVRLWSPASRTVSANCILCPEIFGITQDIEGIAVRIAQMGCLVAVPDFHHRSAPNTVLSSDDAGRARGLELLKQLSREAVLTDLAATKAFLEATGHPSYSDIIGISAGGHIAYFGATVFGFRHTICIYPGWIGNSGIPLSQPDPTITLTRGIARQGGHLQIFIGDADHLVPEAELRAIAEALKDAGVRHDIIVYPGVGHGFMIPGRASYDVVAVDDVWRRLEQLMRQTR